MQSHISILSTHILLVTRHLASFPFAPQFGLIIIAVSNWSILRFSCRRQVIGTLVFASERASWFVSEWRKNVFVRVCWMWGLTGGVRWGIFLTPSPPHGSMLYRGGDKKWGGGLYSRLQLQNKHAILGSLFWTACCLLLNVLWGAKRFDL